MAAPDNKQKVAPVGDLLPFRMALLLLGLLGWLHPGLAPAQDIVWSASQLRTYADLQTLRLPAPTPPGEPSNGVAIFLADYADMLMLTTSDDDRLFASLSRREDDRIRQLSALDERSPWQRVLQAEVRLHWAFCKLKFGKELSASWDVIRAYRLLTENQQLFPAFTPTYKSLGTLQIMIGSVPDAYAWVARLLGLRGSIAQGQQLLLRARQDPVFGLEARLIDLMIRAYVLSFGESDERALQQLVADHPDNLLLHFFGATIAQKNGHGEQALAYLSRRPTGPAYRPLPIVDNILGDIYLQKGQYATADACFGRFLANYRGQNFLKDSYYKRFLCHWLAGQPDSAGRPLLARVLQTGRTTVESDKAAQRFAEGYLKRGPTPNQALLMRARLACDGGFTDQALGYLRPYSEARFSGLPEQAEFNYRMGRIQQRRNAPDAAIPYFVRALALSDAYDGAPLSFGATSALQLGYIYKQKNDRTRARSFFERALAQKNHEYKNSIDNKARAGLSGL
ncbi:hypothetical protein GCM10027578_29010 [Spirosoma luteolum]